jgi:hypothetical protein
VTSFLGPKLLRLMRGNDRQRFPDRRQRGCDSLVQHSKWRIVVVTEADISSPQHPDIFHTPSSSAVEKSLKHESDPPAFLVIFERTSLSLSQAAVPWFRNLICRASNS